MKYQVETASNKGVVRPNNEDVVGYGVNQKLGILWMLVADGMGGHKAGEVASEMLLCHIKKQINNLSVSPVKGWQEWIVEQIEDANTAIFDAAENNSEYSGMGTTGVLAIIASQQCHIGWVGDSRAYLFSQSELTQKTQDHSMIQYLLDKGAITAEDAEKSNTKHLLSRAIGVKNKLQVDTISFAIKSGDILMLSTDGIHDYLSKEVMVKHLINFSESDRQDQSQEKSGSNTNQTDRICNAMIEQAIVQSSRDNLTLGLIKIYN